MTPSSTPASLVLGSQGNITQSCKSESQVLTGLPQCSSRSNSYSSPAPVSLTGDICLHVITSERKLSAFFILHLAFCLDFSFCLRKESLLSKLNLGRCALVYPGSHFHPPLLYSLPFFLFFFLTMTFTSLLLLTPSCQLLNMLAFLTF